MKHWRYLCWLDNCKISLKAAKKAKANGEYSDAIVHLQNLIHSAQEAIERLKQGEK